MNIDSIKLFPSNAEFGKAGDSYYCSIPFALYIANHINTNIEGYINCFENGTHTICKEILINDSNLTHLSDDDIEQIERILKHNIDCVIDMKRAFADLARFEGVKNGKLEVPYRSIDLNSNLTVCLFKNPILKRGDFDTDSNDDILRVALKFPESGNYDDTPRFITKNDLTQLNKCLNMSELETLKKELNSIN